MITYPISDITSHPQIEIINQIREERILKFSSHIGLYVLFHAESTARIYYEEYDYSDSLKSRGRARGYYQRRAVLRTLLPYVQN